MNETIFDIIIGSQPGQLELTASIIGVPLSLAFSVIGAGTVLLTATMGSATFAYNFSQIFQFLKLARYYLVGLVRFRKNRPWGRILDKFTGRPIPLATVRIFSAEFNKLLSAHFSDINGRFDALILPGRYYVEVSKRDYQNFHSEIVDITSENQILNIEVSLIPSAQLFNLNYLRKVNFIQALRNFLKTINPFILIFGTINSFIMMCILPSIFDYFIFWFYIFLDILNFYFAYKLKKPFGIVEDMISKTPLPLSVVRIFDNGKNWLWKHGLPIILAALIFFWSLVNII